MITQDQIRELRELYEKRKDLFENDVDFLLVLALHNAAPDLLDAAEGAIRLRELVKVMREELGVMLNQVNDMEWVGLDGAAFLKKVHATRALASKEVAP